MKFVSIPNLPENDVAVVIASGEISPESEYTLNSYGITVCKTRPHEKLYNAVKFHPDMVFHHMGDNFAVAELSMSAFFSGIIPSLNICSGNSIKEQYPYDIAYNSARVGQYLICNRAYTDQIIIKNAQENGLDIIDVKQGYAKCNICPIAENAIITSDYGIKSALGKFPIDVLLVNDDSVLLKGFAHGFFGGATGKISCDKLAVNGNIRLHKNADEIIEFAKKYSIEIISLNNNY
ncbi:MAG: hypothetical protein IJ366_09630, partial [Clostridia bacterium]|nr:hypothetical protein [Clostridia bacterium]